MTKQMGNIFATQKPSQCSYNKQEIGESVNYSLHNSFHKLFYSKGTTYSKDEINNKLPQLMNTMCNCNHNNIYYTRKETLNFIKDTEIKTLKVIENTEKLSSRTSVMITALC